MDLTDSDKRLVQGVEDRIRDTAMQLGYCREEYLQNERMLTDALTALRSERRQLLDALARSYIDDEDPAAWQYNADNMAFEPRKD